MAMAGTRWLAAENDAKIRLEMRILGLIAGALCSVGTAMAAASARRNDGVRLRARDPWERKAMKPE